MSLSTSLQSFFQLTCLTFFISEFFLESLHIYLVSSGRYLFAVPMYLLLTSIWFGILFFTCERFPEFNGCRPNICVNSLYGTMYFPSSRFLLCQPSCVRSVRDTSLFSGTSNIVVAESLLVNYLRRLWDLVYSCIWKISASPWFAMMRLFAAVRYVTVWLLISVKSLLHCGDFALKWSATILLSILWRVLSNSWRSFVTFNPKISNKF